MVACFSPFSDGTKQTVVASASEGNSINVIDAFGREAPGMYISFRKFYELVGWPLTLSDEYVRASPLLYDIDKDDINDILLATLDGKVYFVRYVSCIMDTNIKCYVDQMVYYMAGDYNCQSCP